MPEEIIDVLSYYNREIDLVPRLTQETNLMTIHIRLAENVKQEEIAYWCPSILDLFGLWEDSSVTYSVDGHHPWGSFQCTVTYLMKS